MKLMHEKLNSHGIRRMENLVQEELTVVLPDCFYQGHLFSKKTRHRKYRRRTEGILEGANKQKKLKGNRTYMVFSEGRTWLKNKCQTAVPRSKNSHALPFEELLHFS